MKGEWRNESEGVKGDVRGSGKAQQVCTTGNWKPVQLKRYSPEFQWCLVALCLCATVAANYIAILDVMLQIAA